MRAPFLALFLTVTVIVPVAAARADEAGATSPEKLARERFRQAEIDFNLGKFAEALSGYQAAYEAKPLTAFLFNIAQCYRNLGNYERARFFYKRYLTLEPKSPNRRVVQDLITEVTHLMKNAPAEAPASENRAEAATATVTPPAEAPAATTPPSPPATPALTLAAPAPSATAASDPALITTAAPPPEPGRPIYKRWWFWTGIAAVVAGGVVAAVVLTRPEASHGTLPPIDARQ